MSSKLEILSQVMLSLKVDQSTSMHNINVLLNNASTEVNLFDKIKHELGELSSTHNKMEECESFMLQLAQASINNDSGESENKE
jgi:hypothetical protein